MAPVASARHSAPGCAVLSSCTQRQPPLNCSSWPGAQAGGCAAARSASICACSAARLRPGGGGGGGDGGGGGLSGGGGLGHTTLSSTVPKAYPLTDGEATRFPATVVGSTQAALAVMELMEDGIVEVYFAALA